MLNHDVENGRHLIRRSVTKDERLSGNSIHVSEDAQKLFVNSLV